MSLMTNQLNKIIRGDEKNFGYDVDQFMFKSDFLNFDYLNGQVDTLNGKEVFNVGIDSGKSIMIVGKPGTGKSTFGIQLAYSIMKKYEESTMFILDFEQSHTKARIKSITGMTEEYYNDHIIMSKVNIYVETVLKLVKQIATFKKEHEKELLIENKEGVRDANGKLKKILPPTFIFIDSIASMKTKDYQEGDELNGLTAGGRGAINNKELFNRILQPCMDANIIVIAINQITQNMSMGVTPPVAQTRYLKNTEAVSGGSGIQFLTNLFIKIEAGDKFEDDGGKNDRWGGVKGFRALLTIVKSRNTDAGRATSFIFNQREGFDPDLSMFEFLQNNGYIGGKGAYLFLPGLEDVKFRMSTIKSTLAENPAFREKFDELCQIALEQSVSVSSKIKFAADEEVVTEEQEQANEDFEDIPTGELTDVE